jgi:alkylation response protein AidB-like acyl-CoA dehydrogenase
MTFARSTESGDVAVVLVERGDAGVEITPYPAVGLRSAGIARVRFHSVRVPAERLLLATDGISYGQRFLNERRLEMPCWALGRMRTLFERCVAELSQRQRYRLPVTEMQAVQAAIGRMFVALETSSLVVANALERVRCAGHDRFWDTAIAVSKYYVVNQALDMCRTAQHILGGASVFLESPYERYMRDFQCLVPIAGTQAILEVDLGILAIGEIERRLAQSCLEVHV